jgi:hypothetical protein
MGYQIHAAVKEQIDERWTPDPDILADMLAENVPSNRLRQAVRDLLPLTIALAQRSQRAVIFGAEQRERTVSGATQAARAWDVTIAIPDEAGYLRKWLQELTAEDCRAVADGYRVRSASNAKQADRFDRLAAVVPVGGTVGDVPAEQVREALS